ncbi:MAG TPA: hemerythrin domain-containing protein [Mycobacteriales bacterium]|nr:hemerythrin domain-containing protein [Mycobacteriales bacterium]
MSAAALTRPDTTDMVAVHRVFRESLGVAPQLIGSVPGDDAERVNAVAGYYADILAFLHVHHEGEDELLWPKLIERCPEQADVIRRIAGQHEGVLTALQTAETYLEAWKAEPTTDNAATLAAALITLAVGLGAHLDEEERVILPLAADHLTGEEWGALPAHGMQNFRGERIWLILGLIREQMTDTQRSSMDAHMPPPVREFWVNVGEPQFVKFIADIRR